MVQTNSVIRMELFYVSRILEDSNTAEFFAGPFNNWLAADTYRSDHSVLRQGYQYDIVRQLVDVKRV